MSDCGYAAMPTVLPTSCDYVMRIHTVITSMFLYSSAT